MFVHKLPNSSHTNTDITPLHCSLGLNIHLLQFVLLQQGGAKICPSPAPMAEAAAFSKAYTHPGESGEQPLPLGDQ